MGMTSERISLFFRRAEKEEPLAKRLPRMDAGALAGFLAGVAFGLTVGTVDAILFRDLPIKIEWGSAILTGLVLGVTLLLVGALTAWYSERTLGVMAGAVAIAIVGLGVQLIVVGVGAVGVIMLVVLAFPISVISLPIAICLRWLGDQHFHIFTHLHKPWARAGWAVVLVCGALLLGILPGSFQRMNLREERSARLVDDALRLAPTDPAQAKKLPLDTLPGLRDHLSQPHTLRVTPSKISSVGYDVHVYFPDGFAITCVTVAYTSTPYLRSCAPGAEIIINK